MHQELSERDLEELEERIPHQFRVERTKAVDVGLGDVLLEGLLAADVPIQFPFFFLREIGRFLGFAIPSEKGFGIPADAEAGTDALVPRINKDADILLGLFENLHDV